jgi:putative glutamine amidotransferase
MVPSATTPDGCIEAFESVDGKTIAVQWHPEVDAATVPHQQALFDWLVAAARATSRECWTPQSG